MTARVTQQVTQVGYSTTPPVRVSTIAVELIRSISASSIGGSNIQTFVITS